MDKTKKQIKPMECPVCHKFYFTKLEEWEIEAGETPNEQFCFRCGWHYDLEQLSDPDLKNQSNEMSLNEYRTWYKQKRKESKNGTISKNTSLTLYLQSVPFVGNIHSKTNKILTSVLFAGGRTTVLN